MLDQSICCNEKKMNECIFLAGLTLQLSCFHGEKTLLLPLGPGHRFIKTCLPAVSEILMIHQVHTVRTHEKEVRGKCTCVQVTLVALIRWNYPVRGLPSKKGQASCSCQKTQILDQIFVVMKTKISVFFWLVWGYKYPLFTEGKYTQFPDSPKKFSLQAQSCVKMHLEHTVPFQEKTDQGRVLCEGWLAYLLLPWIRETVLFEFSARSSKQPICLRKLKYMNKIVLLMMRKISQCAFLADLRV